MRTYRTSVLNRTLRQFLVPVTAMLAIACEDSTSPEEPPLPSPAEPAGATQLLSSKQRWADGYVWAGNPISASYTPPATHSYNRAGGPIRIIRPAGTTGRYVVTFTGLSAVLRGTSTVKVTGYGANNSYCKPVTAYLVSDKVEVRCYRGRSGTSVNAAFTLLVSGVMADRAFAYAHQPTATDYSPESRGSWSPAEAMKVKRLGVGEYEVYFTNLRLHSPSHAQVQVNAVGSGKASCTHGDWHGTDDWIIDVSCQTPAGALVDSKFSVLFAGPAEHLAYAFADQLSATTYTPVFASNPSGGDVAITRTALGKYIVRWVGVDGEVLGSGNVQVSAAYGTTRCKATAIGTETAQVQCYSPSGTLVDSYFSVLLGS
jgi:hypothetical protein